MISLIFDDFLADGMENILILQLCTECAGENSMVSLFFISESSVCFKFCFTRGMNSRKAL